MDSNHDNNKLNHRVVPSLYIYYIYISYLFTRRPAQQHPDP